MGRGVEKEYYPTVDVFLPVCKELPALFANTWTHVPIMKYTNHIVYVLYNSSNCNVRKLATTFRFERKWCAQKIGLVSSRPPALIMRLSSIHKVVCYTPFFIILYLEGSAGRCVEDVWSTPSVSQTRATLGIKLGGVIM